MKSFLFLSLYLLAGIFIIRFLLPSLSLLIRIWIGCCLGLIFAMWLPVIISLGRRFNLYSVWFSFIPLSLILLLAYLFKNPSPPRPFNNKEIHDLHILSLVLIPAGLIVGYMHHTHTLLPMKDGSLWVGQSTFGDLSMHLSFITSFKDNPFPPEYSIFPGARLNYPFLVDSLSTSLNILGWNLRNSIIIPNIIMTLLCFSGLFLISNSLFKSRQVALFSMPLFFINGGLGIVYTLDLSASTFLQRMRHILTGFYTTPTNQPEPYNLVWSNVIADMMLPQRTTLAGWTCIMPAIYLLCKLFAPKDNPYNLDLSTKPLKDNSRYLVLLGVIAGLMPMIHTHSFLALALMSFGFMIYKLISSKPRLNIIYMFLVYALITFAFSFPQLFYWTFKQSLNNSNFLNLRFNWVNNSNSSAFFALKDNYFWFYLKNIGIPFIFIIASFFENNPTYRFLNSGSVFIFLVAEFIQFQPNPYDNNKLFYIWYMLSSLVLGHYFVSLYKELDFLKSKKFLALVMCFFFFISGTLSISREFISAYEAYPKSAVDLATYVENSTSLDSVFMTGTHHLNPIASLAGRKIVCGSASWLYFHGIDTSERERDIKNFYSDPLNNHELLQKYSVNYIAVTDFERLNYAIDENALHLIYQPIFAKDDVLLFKVNH